MRTDESANHPTPCSSDRQIAGREAVALVDATPDVLGVLESTLDGHCCNVLLLDSRARAHAEIKRLRPRLVVVCTRFERLESFQLLTMLKLDGATSDIPFVALDVENGPDEEYQDCAAMLGFPADSLLLAS